MYGEGGGRGTEWHKPQHVMVSMETRRWGEVDALHRDARDRVTEVKILDIELHVRMDELSTLKRVGRSRAGGAIVSQLPH